MDSSLRPACRPGAGPAWSSITPATSAPARARQVYRSILAYERALAVGRVLSENQIELLPSINQELDRVTAAIPGSSTYLVAAPQ